MIADLEISRIRMLRLIRVVSLRPLIAIVLLMGLVLSAGCASTPSLSSTNQLLVSKLEQGGLIAKTTDRGVVIYLPSLMFDFESAELTSLATEKIIYIAKISNQGIVVNRLIQVEGHTDSYGDDDYNMFLSKARAEAAADVLIEYSIAPERIQAAWFGHNQPLVPNRLSNGKDNPRGRAANRRVEFVLLNP